MSYCFNHICSHPQNISNRTICSSCGSNLLLRDRYSAIEVIGQGGFGKTYKAVDRADSSVCVIKQFTFAGSSSTALRLFYEEAQQLKTLGSHPQIPTFIYYVKQENQCFLVQEYIDGSNLEEELVANGAFDETQIEQLLTNILPILGFIHDRGVIHRDIKPENIIRRSSDRSLSIVDFGAAKRATETALAKTGTTIGSAGYAAPEQTFGKAVIQSDLYSLGVTCVHLLTGTHPFDLIDSAEGNWVWRDYLKQPVSQKLGQILDKLLERGTRQRYQSAKEVLQDLQFKLNSIAPQTYEQTPGKELLTRRTPAWKIAAVSSLVVGSLIAVPVVTDVLNQSQLAKVPQAQVVTVPQKLNGQPQQLHENKVDNASFLNAVSHTTNFVFILIVLTILMIVSNLVAQVEEDMD